MYLMKRLCYSSQRRHTALTFGYHDLPGRKAHRQNGNPYLGPDEHMHETPESLSLFRGIAKLAQGV